MGSKQLMPMNVTNNDLYGVQLTGISISDVNGRLQLHRWVSKICHIVNTMTYTASSTARHFYDASQDYLLSVQIWLLNITQKVQFKIHFESRKGFGFLNSYWKTVPGKWTNYLKGPISWFSRVPAWKHQSGLWWLQSRPVGIIQQQPDIVCKIYETLCMLSMAFNS